MCLIGADLSLKMQLQFTEQPVTASGTDMLNELIIMATIRHYTCWLKYSLDMIKEVGAHIVGEKAIFKIFIH